MYEAKRSPHRYQSPDTRCSGPASPTGGHHGYPYPSRIARGCRASISCDCAWFISYQRCKHHSALLVALGWLEDPDPEPPTPIAPVIGRILRCETCRGLGEVQYTRVTGPARFVSDWQTCSACRGRGVEKIVTEAA